MNNKELRIGNWVITNKGEQVLDVLCDSINTFQCAGIPYDEVFPIPLTEKWLIKFGFEKQEVEAKGLDTWNEWSLDRFELSSRGTEGVAKNEFTFIVYETGLTIKIKYVHQLQNLYFALTGKELII